MISPGCEIYGEEVPWYKALSPKVRLGALGGVAVLAGIIALVAFKKDPFKQQLTTLQAEVQQLEGRLTDLEGKPQGDPSLANAAEVLNQMPEKIAAAEERLASAIQNVDAPAVAKEREDFVRLKQQRSQLEQSFTGSPAGATVKADASALVSSYQEAGDRVEALATQVTTAGDSKLAPDCSALQEEVEQGLGRASRLVKISSGGATARPSVSSKDIDAAIARFEATLATYKSAVAEPFSAEQATLKIAVTGDLADTLVLPILKGREKGEVIVANGKSFFTSRPAAGVTRRVIIERIPGDGSFDRLSEKKADLVISDQQPSTLQRQRFSNAFQGSTMDSHSNAQVIAMDALTFVVHPDNRLDRLGSDDLQRSQNFLGGVKGSAEQMAATRFGISLTSNSDRRAADAVLSDPSAVGVGLYHNEGSNIRAKRLAYQAAPNALSLKPSPFTIATEDYKFAFRIVAWNSPSSSRDAVDLVKFITSPAGQDLVGQQGFVDLRLRPMAGDLDPRILAALAQATGLKKISGAQRLSTNFRFATGEDRFDLKALGDLERVPPQIARDFPNARVVILGFTDNTGGGSVNLPLSQRRAEAVAAELRRSGLDAKTAGMGDQLPVDSNGTEEGKARNRRSEIWIVTP